jgi:hypothetical protein
MDINDQMQSLSIKHVSSADIFVIYCTVLEEVGFSHELNLFLE